MWDLSWAGMSCRFSLLPQELVIADFEPDADRSWSIGNGTRRCLGNFKYRQSSSCSSQLHCSRIGLTRPMSLPNRCHAGTLYPTAIRGIREDACRTTTRSHAAQFLIHYRPWDSNPHPASAREDFKSSASAIPRRRRFRSNEIFRATAQRNATQVPRSVCRNCQSVLRSI